MSENIFNLFNRTPLAGARIWLSGSIPDRDEISDEQYNAILSFIRSFAARIFKQGGHIVHGSHPSFTPILLEEARNHQSKGGRKDCLILVVSRYWSKDSENVPVGEWEKSAIVYETPEIPGNNGLEESLKLLRKWMASRCEAVVVVGGKWWQKIKEQAGIPLELGFAIDRGLPCFLLGGFGGAAKEFVESHPELLTQLKNGLGLNENQKLFTNEDSGNITEQVCNQLEMLPLVRGRETDGISFRILALDGGGLKGAFTASVLATWEKLTGLRIVDHFDLIAGTSTGGILAIGLGLGLSGQEMLDFYKKRGPIIFPVTRFRSKAKHTLRHICVPKYSQTLLLRELESAYYKDGKKVYLKNSLCRLIIPAYHAVAGASYLFRTPHHPDLTADANAEAAHVALATSAAPTFFTAAKIANMVSESSYFDGGVWANSPVMAAIIEAVTFLKIPLERIDVLSIGTTEEPFTVRKQSRSGLVGWVRKKKILDLLMNVQQESSLKLAEHLVSNPRFLRVNVTTVPGSYSLDGPNEIDELADLGYYQATKTDILGQIKSRFLNGLSVSDWEHYE